jgi:sigma-E factor negative regulatory protein RseA
MNDQVNEDLSAWLDDEPPNIEPDILLRRLQNDAELRGRYERYHLIGDALRHDLPAVRDNTLAARISAGLRDEAPHRGAAHGAGRGGWQRALGGLAIAASVAVVAVLGVQSLTREPVGAPGSAQLADATPPADAPQAPLEYARAPAVRWDLEQPEVESTLNDYLLSHNGRSATTGVQGMMPYGRIVGYQSGE